MPLNKETKSNLMLSETIFLKSVVRAKFCFVYDD